MTIELPNLDDRTFTQLVREARRRIEQTCPEWTDLSAHDPGMTLVEVFAHLTEVLIYRLNRLPDKAFVAFLNLLGVRRQPPVAASAVLTFRRESATGEVDVPAGTRVTIEGGSGGDAPVFVTESAVTLAADADEVEVRAHHCDWIEGELVGRGTGSPGQVVRVSRPPIVQTGASFDLLVGVEDDSERIPEGAPAREWQGRTFRIWEPVWSFAGHSPSDAVYVVDRADGRVTFAPAVSARTDPEAREQGPAASPDRTVTLAAVPPPGREIRMWYRSGGGPGGNVAAGALTVLRDPIPGVAVSNDEAARGGQEIESVDHLLTRGPNEFLTVRRAVTSADFEVLAVQSSGAVARAKAITRAEAWTHAKPGEVEVVLVPHVPGSTTIGSRIDLDTLTSLQTEEARSATERELELRRPLGTRCVVGWARYKPVSVRARVVVGPQEDQHRVHERVLSRLYQTISPLPEGAGDGWRFGHPLRRSNIYRLLEQAEPGVEWVDDVVFEVADAPDGEIDAVAADGYQPGTWYAASGGIVFRSTNDADGWEPAASFPGERVWVVEPYPSPDRPGVVAHPGLVAAATRAEDGRSSAIHVSEDLGETWRRVGGLDVGVTDLAWTHVGDTPGLLITTNTGLYRLALLPGAAPVQVVVDPADADRGFYAVVSFTDPAGDWWAAVASQAEHGVYLTTAPGRLEEFANIGLAGQDTRALSVQFHGTAAWLWVGVGEANPDLPGTGPVRARLFENDVRWEPPSDGWSGGTCWAVDLHGRVALAASQSGGVLRLDTATPGAAWQGVDVNSGLALRDQGRFHPVTTLAVNQTGLALAGGSSGVHRSVGESHQSWQPCDHRRAEELVTIPSTWLMCSADHQIEVVTSGAP
ncbi:MAG: putative baseplate assembly protein [Acidimicrobiales bacterium]